MIKCCKKPTVYTAERFFYVDGIDGHKTSEEACRLGLSTNGSSKLWEIKTVFGWKLVDHKDWLLIKDGVVVDIISNKDFKASWLELDENCQVLIDS